MDAPPKGNEKMHRNGVREHQETSKEVWGKTYYKVARRTQTA